MQSRRAQSSGRMIATTKIVHWQTGSRPKSQVDDLAREEPLEIRVRSRTVAVTMRTPGHDQELAAGFLLSESLIQKRMDVVEIVPCQRGEALNHQNIINVFLSGDVELDFEKLTRHVFTSSSCGVCGKTTIDAVHQHFAPSDSKMIVQGRMLISLPERLRAAQKTFSRTGGLHAAAVFNAWGDLVVLREDVGRHNAVDKVIGFGFLENRLPFDQHILMVSGRASFEIMQKALAARIPVVAAVSAPSSLAMEFARQSNQTLIGFLRGQGFNIYSGRERVQDKG